MQYQKLHTLKNALTTICIILLIICIFNACDKKLEEPVELRDVNEALISDLDSVYRIEPNAILQLKPKVAFTMDKEVDASRYSYEWLGARYLAGNYQIISTTKQLEFESANQGPYTLWFRVTDRQTNLFTEKQIHVIVANAVYEGWMLLEERNGQTQFDMLSYQANRDQYKYIENVLNVFHPQDAIQGKPLFTGFNAMSFFDLFSDGLVIGTNQHIPVYDNSNINFKGDLEAYLPIDGSADFKNLNYEGRYYRTFFNIDGDLYVSENAVSVFNQVNQVQELDGTLKPFNAAPFMAIENGVNQEAVFFDEDAKELLRFNPIYPYCHHFGLGKLFDFKTAKNLLYLGYTEKEGGQYVALLQVPDTKEVYLARFSSFDQLYYEKIRAPMIEKAEQFALHPATGTLCYNIGEKLYAVDEMAKESRLLATFDGAIISKIKFNSFSKLFITNDIPNGLATFNEERYKTLQNQLIVCTYNPLHPDASGTFALFDVDLNRWTLQERFRQEGLSKIVDVVYKER